MGADLYRSDFKDSTATLQRTFEDACAARDRYVLSVTGTLLSIPTEDPEYQLLQDRVWQAYDAIYDHPRYFRDAYNESSLLWKLDLSWWDLDQQGLLSGPSLGRDEDGWEEFEDPSPEQLRQLLDRIKERSELLAYNIRDLPDQDDELLDKHYFTEKYDRLIDFLQQAIDGGHTIHFSV